MTPRRLLPLAEARRPLFAGVDLGGTNIKATLVDDEGRMVAFHAEPTLADRGPEDAAMRMGRAVHTLAQSVGITAADILRVGLGTPGPQDLPAGVILRAGNLPGWDGFPVRDRVAVHCGRPVTYANDATAAAYGEFWVGSGRAESSLLPLTLGTGVGGGIIIGDMTIDGAHSHASECGHIIVDPFSTARMCPCGKTGHLEAYASATALIARTREAIETVGGGTLAAAVADGAPLTPVLVAEHVAEGDELATVILMDTACWLAIGIVTLMHTLDPAAVILGGAMTFGGAEHPVGGAFLDRIRQEVRSRTFPLLAEKTPIRYAELGGDAGAIGAAGLARIDHRRGG